MHSLNSFQGNRTIYQECLVFLLVSLKRFISEDDLSWNIFNFNQLKWIGYKKIEEYNAGRDTPGDTQLSLPALYSSIFLYPIHPGLGCKQKAWPSILAAHSSQLNLHSPFNYLFACYTNRLIITSIMYESRCCLENKSFYFFFWIHS